MDWSKHCHVPVGAAPRLHTTASALEIVVKICANTHCKFLPATIGCSNLLFWMHSQHTIRARFASPYLLVFDPETLTVLVENWRRSALFLLRIEEDLHCSCWELKKICTNHVEKCGRSAVFLLRLEKSSAVFFLRIEKKSALSCGWVSYQNEKGLLSSSTATKQVFSVLAKQRKRSSRCPDEAQVHARFVLNACVESRTLHSWWQDHWSSDQHDFLDKAAASVAMLACAENTNDRASALKHAD